MVLEKNLKVTMMGEIMMTRRISVYDHPNFLKVIGLLREADVAFVNLEGLPGNFQGYQYSNFDALGVSSPAFIADELKWAGFNLISIANNHSLDFSPENLFSAMKNLTNAGLVYAGAGKDLDAARIPGYLETNKGLVALVASTSGEQEVTYYQQHTRAGNPGGTFQGRPGVNGIRVDPYYTVDPSTYETVKTLKKAFYDSNRVSYLHFGRKEKMETQRLARPTTDPREELFFLGRRFVKDQKQGIGIHWLVHPKDRLMNVNRVKAAAKQADWAFMSHHAHETIPYLEDETQPADHIIQYAHNCIDAGADAYLGHGPHAGQGIEIYKDRPILYSLATPMFSLRTRTRVTPQSYEIYGLSEEKSLADYYEGANRPDNWLHTVLAEFTLAGEKGARRLTELKLYPIDGGYNKPLPQFGVYPVLIEDEPLARRIIERYQRLSAPFGTKITYKDKIGIVKIQD